MSKSDWNKVKLDYLSGMSRKEICDKYNIEYEALNSKIKTGKWTKIKDQIDQKVDQKLEEKASDLLAEKQVKFIERQYKLAEKILNKIENEFDKTDKLMDMSVAVNSLREGIKIGRQAINLFDTTKVDSKVEYTLDPEILAVAKILNERKQNKE